MPAVQKFGNFAASVISNGGAGMAIGGTTLNLLAGGGAKFPTCTLGTDYFYAVIYQKSGQYEINHEVVKVTQRVGDVLTIVRAQDGTTAKAFNDGDPVELRFVAGSIQAVLDQIVADNAAAIAQAIAIMGTLKRQVITSNLTFTVPNTPSVPGGTTMDIYISGIGPGGKGGNGGTYGGGQGGGQGQILLPTKFTVTCGSQHVVSLGTAASNTGAGAVGAAATFGALVTLNPGPDGVTGSAVAPYSDGHDGQGSGAGRGSPTVGAAAPATRGTNAQPNTGSGGGGAGGGGSSGAATGGDGSLGHFVVEW